MTTQAALDPSTGNIVHTQQHRFLLTMVDDAAYLGLMVYVYDMTGFKNVFIGLPQVFFSNPFIVQALRYGIMFASMLEIRRWLTAFGISTELIAYYLEGFARRVA